MNTTQAKTIIENDDIAPGHFGPNALPIPDMLDGVAKNELHLELSGDYHQSFRGDKTLTQTVKIIVPLYPDWVNFSIWVPLREWYKNSDNSHLRPQPEQSGKSGKESGDIYISTDIQILKQGPTRPDIIIRAGIKTASGGSFEEARYMDSPGYFFDATLAKSIKFDNEVWKELRVAGSAGFLCWQVGDALQNDAYMYGVQAKLKTKYVTSSVTWSGYTGWIGNGDAPMSIKAEIRGDIKRFEPFIGYQYGLRDYPYNNVRIGLAYRINVNNFGRK